MGIAAMVLGIIGIVFSWIPFVNFIAGLLGFLATLFGAIGIAGNHKGPAIAGLVLGLVTLMIVLGMYFGGCESLLEVCDDFVDSSSYYYY